MAKPESNNTDPFCEECMKVCKKRVDSGKSLEIPGERRKNIICNSVFATRLLWSCFW